MGTRPKGDWPPVPGLEDDESYAMEDEGYALEDVTFPGKTESSESKGKASPSVGMVVGAGVFLLLLLVPIIILWIKLVSALWEWSPSI